MAYFTYPLAKLYPLEFSLIDRPHRAPVTYQHRVVCNASIDLDSGNCHFEDVLPEIYEQLNQQKLEVDPVFDRDDRVQLIELRLLPVSQSDTNS